MYKNHLLMLYGILRWLFQKGSLTKKQLVAFSICCVDVFLSLCILLWNDDSWTPFGWCLCRYIYSCNYILILWTWKFNSYSKYVRLRCLPKYFPAGWLSCIFVYQRETHSYWWNSMHLYSFFIKILLTTTDHDGFFLHHLASSCIISLPYLYFIISSLIIWLSLVWRTTIECLCPVRHMFMILILLLQRPKTYYIVSAFIFSNFLLQE